MSLDELCALMRSVNPRLRVLLTVSPVPLIATYEDRHVLVSTTLSKAVLRVAADAAQRRFDFVDYFPSFELIAASSAGGQYLEPDLREVRDVGVAHVMRCFSRHYVEGGPAPTEVDTPRPRRPPPPTTRWCATRRAVEAAPRRQPGWGLRAPRRRRWPPAVDDRRPGARSRRSSSSSDSARVATAGG